MHTSRSESVLHYTLRGFDDEGWAHATMHLFENGDLDLFWNGGRTYGYGSPGSHRLRLESGTINV